MSRRYSIAEARATLPSIVDEVADGGPVEITRRGKPIAVVLSLSQYESLKAGRTTFAESYARFRSAHDVSEVGVDEELFPRDRSAGRQVHL
jgi:prevent-host-death family protein